ncbi:dixin isoform X1 [Biomphalaria glabrata]|nr:dixin isoform X1 [Biomphalaria glabrata]
MLPSVKNARKSRYPSGSPARACEDAQILVEWQKQLTAYVAWVNSQLKKKPGAHLVEDLRNDVRDGVALIDLIQVIANEEIEGAHPAPSTYSQMKENVDKVLLFMSAHKIKMHHITTRDIVEGNLKAIMRLVLALAAHYKPNSVRHSSQANKQNTGIAGIAQGAAATLTEARRNASRAGHRYRRRRQREDSSDMMCSDSDHSQNYGSSQKKSTSSSNLSHSQHHYHHQHSHHRHTDQRLVGEGESGLKIDCRAELEGASASSSPVSSHNASPRASLYLTEPSSSMEGLLAVAGSNKAGAVMVTSCESDAMVDSGYTEIVDSIKDTHQMLFQLHDLLLNGENTPSEPLVSGVAQSSNIMETITILKARVLHNEEIAETLRVENNKIKNECRELYGTKAALQQRLAEQESQLSSVKSELMTLELAKETLALETETLKKQLSEREQILSDVKKSYVRQVEEKDKLISDLRKELLKRDHAATIQNEQNNHMEKFDHKVGDRSDLAELEILRDNFKQARTQISFEDPGNALMDSLENGLSRLLDKVHINGSMTGVPVGLSLNPGKVKSPMSKPAGSPRAKKVIAREPLRVTPRTPQHRVTSSSPGRGSPVWRGGGVVQQSVTRVQLSKQFNPSSLPSKGSPGRGGKSQIPVLNDLTVSGSRAKGTSPSPTEPLPTNVIYYISNSDKPFTCLIRKKLGEIRLRDLKCVIPDSNLYHYFFKALDPEYGSVKEELSNDDDILPGWEGKIVAWLEEETGTAC